MLTEKNFAAALTAMNFTRNGNRYEKIFADNIKMAADLSTQKLFYPTQIKGRDRNNFFDDSHRENLVVFECVNRLLDKGYKPDDIELERRWTLGHSTKGGRADICVSADGRTLFIVECKTAGTEFNHERKNMLADGGQLFSYWQQEQSCQWLVLYAADFTDADGLKFFVASVPCDKKFYRDAHTVTERFNVWRERYEQKILDDVIFHDETVAYKIGAKPLRKRDLKNFKDTGLVNQFEEILRHNQVSDKENAFNRLVALFICKLADESLTPDDGEVSFQFKTGSDTYESFQDRLQKFYADGMKKFMGEDIFYLPEDYPERLFENFRDEENHDSQISDLRENFRRLKFYTNNAFAFVDVNNDKLFYLNAKILKEVVDKLRGYKIIGSTDLQTLGDLFEQLLSKGFRQDEGQFFTPTPIARFIWDSLPLDKIISDAPPKIIDYACGAGHFLTEGFRAVNDCYARKNLSPPVMWERDKIFGVEKDYRLARVSKISLFMHGAGEGKIKFGDGLENYPDENITPKTFDVLVANPPYSVKGFKSHLKLTDEEDFTVLNEISNSGSEIETVFVERISQLVKPQGVAAVLLPSSILNKDGKSFIAARQSLLKNFFIRAIVQLGNKTFGATSTATVIIFLEHFDEPPRRVADFEDVADTILAGKSLGRQFSRDIFSAYLKKIGTDADAYRNFIANADDKIFAAEREKIIFFGLTYQQTTLVVTAPADNKAQEIFLGYGWSNAKGREGMVDKKRGGLLFDYDNRVADNTIAAVVRAAYEGRQLRGHSLEKFFHYATLADLLDFDADNFTKKITLAAVDYTPADYTGTFPLVKLGDVCAINIPKSEVADVDNATLVSFVEMASVSNDGFIAEKVERLLGDVRNRGYKYFAEGDIIVAKITPCMENGKCAIAHGLTNSIGFGSTEFHVFRCNAEKILTEYLFVFINREEIRQAAQKHMTGSSGHRRVPEDFYFKLMLPLPPLDVQKKIVVEFNAIDAAIAEQLDIVRQLDADIQNKFTALFGDIERGYKYPMDSFEKFVYVRGGDTFKEKYQGSKNSTDIPFYKVSDMNSAGNERIMSAANNYVAETTLLNEIRATVFEVGTIIFPKVGMAIKTNKKRILGRRAAVDNNTMAIWRKNDFLNNEYLYAFLNFCVDLSSISNNANPPSISAANFNRAKIMVPPLTLQEEFAAYVTNCESMKKSARQRRDELIGERAELVTKYFR